ncbi:hypothetical protein ILUMI_26153 [Ignelater luminosus]|uniref:Uncharacterized protein n=1 Tax=Ignelater luminosus TaxID=2038154 RepID=A0A8K0FXH7_IGNLU|nr:hypothetical protein ILUMI_26153 [Ignelater luminosus]
MSRITNVTSSRSQTSSGSSYTWFKSGISLSDVGEKRNICIVEGSDMEKSWDLRTNEMSKSVWRNVKPPCNFDMYQPIISARRTEIVRAQLNRKIKSSQRDMTMPKAPKNVVFESKGMATNLRGLKFSKF